MIKIIAFLRKPIGSLLILAMVFAISGATYIKASGHLSPGPVSATHPQETPINGYISHADFEKECGHCHAPVHCVTDSRCQDCHKDVALQRSETHGLHGKLPGTDRCQNCHIEHQGREVVITQFAFPNVDHKALAGFSLALHRVDYQDELMNCESCHSQERFADETLDCVTCHVEENHEYMAEHIETYGLDCVPCHDGVDRMRDFDHQLAYALDGAHSETECTACHANQVYLETVQECSGCHEDPEMHAGKFGLECERCHSAVAWTPAKLVRHNFFLNHGSETNAAVECEVCHVDSMVVNTCYGCHEHQPADMDQVHLAEGIEEYSQCEQCHPTGQEGEAAALMTKQSHQPSSIFESLFSSQEPEVPVSGINPSNSVNSEGGELEGNLPGYEPGSNAPGNGQNQGGGSSGDGAGQTNNQQPQSTPQAPGQGPGNGNAGNK